jgi:hypothetical protein
MLLGMTMVCELPDLEVEDIRREALLQNMLNSAGKTTLGSLWIGGGNSIDNT